MNGPIFLDGVINNYLALYLTILGALVTWFVGSVVVAFGLGWLIDRNEKQIITTPDADEDADDEVEALARGLDEPAPVIALPRPIVTLRPVRQEPGPAWLARKHLDQVPAPCPAHCVCQVDPTPDGAA